MTPPYPDEVKANMERAIRSIEAARQLMSGGYLDFAASRAYYAAFYAASAVLLAEGTDVSKRQCELSPSFISDSSRLGDYGAHS